MKGMLENIFLTFFLALLVLASSASAAMTISIRDPDGSTVVSGASMGSCGSSGDMEECLYTYYACTVPGWYQGQMCYGGGACSPWTNLWNCVVWSVSLSASTASLLIGYSSTLTATANMDVAPTPYYIRIYEGITQIASCSSGTTCSTTVSSSTATTRIFTAKIEKSDGTDIQATSSLVSVTWIATDLGGNVKVKRTTDTVYSSSTIVPPSSQVNVKVIGTVTTSGVEMYRLGVLGTGIGWPSWEYCCCDSWCKTSYPSDLWCDTHGASYCDNVWTTTSLSTGSYSYDGAVYDYHPISGGDLMDAVGPATVTVGECATDADCVSLGVTCEPPLGSYPNRYAECDTGAYTCSDCRSCTTRTHCEPTYCCTYESIPGPGEATGRCLSQGTIINPYLCN